MYEYYIDKKETLVLNENEWKSYFTPSSKYTYINIVISFAEGCEESYFVFMTSLENFKRFERKSKAGFPLLSAKRCL